jgi:hypothetical protein
MSCAKALRNATGADRCFATQAGTFADSGQGQLTQECSSSML